MIQQEFCRECNEVTGHKRNKNDELYCMECRELQEYEEAEHKVYLDPEHLIESATVLAAKEGVDSELQDSAKRLLKTAMDRLTNQLEESENG